MDAVIDLGQISLDVPAKLFHFLGLESFKFFDQIDFELRADPHAELKGNVFVGICTAYLPAFARSPIACVFSTHSLTLSL